MTTDSASRGAHLLAATAQLIASGGLAAVSIRAVAAAAGVSLAQVQYYFHSKDALVEAAFAWTSDRFLAELAGVVDCPPSLPRLRQLVDRWLPLDQAREDRVRVWLAFVATAAGNESMAGQSAEMDESVRAWFAADLRELVAQEAAQVDDPEVTAAQLLALVDGVCSQALALPMNQRTVLVGRTIDPFFARLARTSSDHGS